jgi:lysophospholipase
VEILLNPQTGPQSISVSRYYRELHDSVKAKVDAGFNKTITDYWGRALSYQLVNATDGGPAYTFSSIANDVEFANARAPMPIIVSIERPPGTLLIPENSVIFEFNPWEMGSYDLDVSAFAPLKYIGTDLRNEPTDNECVGGFDNVGFVMGTSSSLFNQAFLQIQTSSDAPGFLVRALNETLEQVGENNRDIATWPNPFYQYNPESNPSSDSTILTLVDGGEDLQNIPLNPLTLTARRVDVILAVDSSADTSTHWPNGTSLVATYRRSASGNSGNNSAFPPVPNTNTFVNLGLNYRPTFFGCSGNDSNNDNTGPLIVYLPNAPYTSNSNFSTFDMEYTTEERNDIVQNGYNVVTMGNGTVDPTWPACLGCAILQRSFGRTNTSPPPACNECFDRYCWNGTVDDSDPGIYEPAMVIPSASGGRRTIASASITLVIVYVILFLVS